MYSLTCLLKTRTRTYKWYLLRLKQWPRLASCIVRSESKSKEAKDLYQGLTATVNGPDLMPFHGKLSFCDWSLITRRNLFKLRKDFFISSKWQLNNPNFIENIFTVSTFLRLIDPSVLHLLRLYQQIFPSGYSKTFLDVWQI